MNKSYSKIRHIKESNLILENRILNEQSDKGLYDLAISYLKKTPTSPQIALERLKKYKTKNQQEENDKNFYISFVESFIKGQPYKNDEYINKRLGYSKNLLNVLKPITEFY